MHTYSYTCRHTHTHCNMQAFTVSPCRWLTDKGAGEPLTSEPKYPLQHLTTGVKSRHFSHERHKRGKAAVTLLGGALLFVNSHTLTMLSFFSFLFPFPFSWFYIPGWAWAGHARHFFLSRAFELIMVNKPPLNRITVAKFYPFCVSHHFTPFKWCFVGTPFLYFALIVFGYI